MSKYASLTSILAGRSGSHWKVDFEELERLIGRSLPASAWKYPAWWSNDPSNNAMTKIWLKAGWRTEQVDIPGQTVVFRRAAQPAAPERKAAGFGGGRSGAFEQKGLAETPRGFGGEASSVASLQAVEADEGGMIAVDEFFAVLPADHPLADLAAFVKGSVRFAPGFDPCAPAMSPEEWAEAEAEMEAEWDELYGPHSDYAKERGTGALRK